VRFVLKDGVEIHRIGPPPEVYDYHTGKLVGRVGPRGRFAPLAADPAVETSWRFWTTEPARRSEIRCVGYGLGFLLSVIGLLAGIWLYLYKTILDLTVNAPADPTLLFMGYVHLTVLCLRFMSFFAVVLQNPSTPTPVQGLRLQRH